VAREAGTDGVEFSAGQAGNRLQKRSAVGRRETVRAGSVWGGRFFFFFFQFPPKSYLVHFAKSVCVGGWGGWVDGWDDSGGKKARVHLRPRDGGRITNCTS
jgi:hypothetical protein